MAGSEGMSDKHGDNWTPEGFMKHLRRPTNADEQRYMLSRMRENRELSAANHNENWLYGKLKLTGFKWTWQVVWGYRIFDFWCHELGIAVECDGPEHRADYDAYRDEYNYRRSGIVVLRVRNRNEEDAALALAFIGWADTWIQRRRNLGIGRMTEANRGGR
jgi:very-short-patch-repair endonuclease